MAEFKKLSEVEQVETASDNATVLIEEGGEIKRVAKSEVGGTGGYTMALTNDNYDGTYCYENYDEMYDILVAGGSAWVDLTAVFNNPYDAAEPSISFSVFDSIKVLVMNWFISDAGLVCDGILPASITG